MKDHVITIDRKNTDGIASTYFSSICGFSRDEEKHREMFNEALRIRDKIADKIHIRAIVSSFGIEAINNKEIILNEMKFQFNFLEHIKIESIHKIYAYILTIGNTVIKDASVLEKFYEDTWGIAYVDAGRDILREELRADFIVNNCDETKINEKEIFISESFGPGFYGMDVTKVRTFFELFQGEKIGVSLLESGLIYPLKSCTGFYMVVDDVSQLPNDECKSCFSNKQGCKFCRATIKDL